MKRKFGSYSDSRLSASIRGLWQKQKPPATAGGSDLPIERLTGCR